MTLAALLIDSNAGLTAALAAGFTPVHPDDGDDPQRQSFADLLAPSTATATPEPQTEPTPVTATAPQAAQTQNSPDNAPADHNPPNPFKTTTSPPAAPVNAEARNQATAPARAAPAAQASAVAQSRKSPVATEAARNLKTTAQTQTAAAAANSANSAAAATPAGQTPAQLLALLLQLLQVVAAQTQAKTAAQGGQAASLDAAARAQKTPDDIDPAQNLPAGDTTQQIQNLLDELLAAGKTGQNGVAINDNGAAALDDAIGEIAQLLQQDGASITPQDARHALAILNAQATAQIAVDYDAAADPINNAADKVTAVLTPPPLTTPSASTAAVGLAAPSATVADGNGKNKYTLANAAPAAPFSWVADSAPSTPVVTPTKAATPNATSLESKINPANLTTASIDSQIGAQIAAPEPQPAFNLAILVKGGDGTGAAADSASSDDLEDGKNPSAPPAVPAAAVDGVTPGNPYNSFNGALAAARTPNPQTANLQTPIDQVILQLNRSVKNGNDQVSIQLQPGDLGKITIKLEIDHGGKVQGTVTANNALTLATLQKDSKSLERALQDAGLRADSGSLQFNFSGNPQQHARQAAQNAAPPATGDEFSLDGDGVTSLSLPLETYYLTPQGVNIHV